MNCAKCDEWKELSEFYKNDRTCKECRKRRVRENRRKNIEYYKEYDRKRANLPHRVEARKAYSQTEAGKAAHKRAHEKQKRKYQMTKTQE